ncbi:MAG: AbrB/MazE/SpoVT family DNA-binding domain-containing protein, partial [Clostridia bacterium]|nr:AbrB/MazE/SpoVT family DNA-binding domain-containing protein [Clostridia bacterium]
EVRAKNQITIPKEISKSLGINVGDQFDMIEKDGAIYMIPVVTYPKAYMDELDKEMEKLRKDIKSGKAKSFDDIDEMLAFLHGKR